MTLEEAKKMVEDALERYRAASTGEMDSKDIRPSLIVGYMLHMNQTILGMEERLQKLERVRKDPAILDAAKYLRGIKSGDKLDPKMAYLLADVMDVLFERPEN